MVPILLILLIVFIGSIFLVFWSYTEAEGSYTIQLEQLNDNVAHQGNFGANIISLSEKDFQAFPKLAPVIRDNTQNPFTTDEKGNRLYRIKITDEERSYLIHQYGYNKLFFEYNRS